jgi:hypothetical protein
MYFLSYINQKVSNKPLYVIKSVLWFLREKKKKTQSFQTSKICPRIPARVIPIKLANAGRNIPILEVNKSLGSMLRQVALKNAPRVIERFFTYFKCLYNPCSSK